MTRCPGALKWTSLAAPLPRAASIRLGSSGLGLSLQIHDFSTFRSVLDKIIKCRLRFDFKS